MPGEITQLLRASAEGDQAASDRLSTLVYPELLRLARRYMNHENPGHTLQPTALVHEAFLRLAGIESIEWNDRVHFFSTAATMMRRILVDHAREKRTAKRGGGLKAQLLDNLAVDETRLDEILQVDTALHRLAERDPRQARVVEMRFFGGLTEEEVAAALNISPRTVKRDWSVARAWLHADIAGAKSTL